MPTGFIEINDAGIRAGIDGDIRHCSAGFAVMDGDRLLIGEEGRKKARLLPRWTNNRFWNQLGVDPVPNGTAMVRHHADLAFAHLEEVWKQLAGETRQVVLAVPGFYSREQLGLLLGMARECGIPVAGLVDTSVLAASDNVQHPTVIHLDIFLHRITLTILRADTNLRRIETVTVSEIGLFTLWDRWANIIASQFIQTSRYDPMHQAISEQALYDQLPEWIAQLEESRSHNFELEYGDTRHRVSVSQEQLLGACATVYPRIVQLIRDHIPQGGSATLLVSDRFTGFPGLMDSLHLIANVDMTILASDSVPRAVVTHEDRIISTSGTVSHVISLPVSLSHNAATTTPPEASTQPTHLLNNNHATAIGNALHIAGITDGRIRASDDNALCTIYRRGNNTYLENHTGAAVILNGRQAPARQALTTGDVLTIDDKSLTLITVT
ncbi:MAG: hypothetical protein WD002_00435 [Pseudomonadales bacterium]